MIITCKKAVPLRWIAFAILPWASFSFNYGVISVVFFFSLRKFVDNPAGLTFILSLPSFVSIILQPTVSFLSDRIRTRFGRRKPFIATSMAGIIICLFLMPLMPNF
jgi:Na+/melibiose symporter-like transporter